MTLHSKPYSEIIGNSPEAIDEWLVGQDLKEVLTLEISRLKSIKEMLFMLFDVASLWGNSPHRLNMFRGTLMTSLEALPQTPAIQNALKELSLIEELDESSLREITHWVLVYTLGNCKGNPHLPLQ